MPEEANDLHVVGCTTAGVVWHTIRSPGRLAPAGTDWLGFGDVLAQPGVPAGLKGRAVDVACARRIGVDGLEDGLWVLIAFRDRPPVLLFRASSPAGTWTDHTTQSLLDVGNASKVALGTVTWRANLETSDPADDVNVLHIAAVTAGYLRLLFGRAEGGAVSEAFDPDEQYGFGRVSAVALDTSFVTGQGFVEMPMVVAHSETPGTQAGSLGLMRYILLVGPEDLEAIGPANTGLVLTEPWDTLLPSPAQTGGTIPLFPPPGTVVVDAALADRSVFAVTGNGPLLPPPPGWPYGPIPVPLAHKPGMALLAPQQLPLRPQPLSLFPRTWTDLEGFTFSSPFGPITAVPLDVGALTTISASKTTEGRHIVATTTTGMLFHQLRAPTATFALFGNVEAAGAGVRGPFMAVDCG